MSQGNVPSSVAIPGVLDSPNNDLQQQLDPELILPEFTEQQYRDSETRAHHELYRIEQEARLLSRVRIPLEPLCRSQRNKLSVKRSRFFRREIDRVLDENIREKHNRNLEKDRLIAIEVQRYYQLKKKAKELERMSEPQPQHELVRFGEETPQHLMQDCLADICGERADNPTTTGGPLEPPGPHEGLEAQCMNLTSGVLTFQSFDGNSDIENDAMQDWELMPGPRWPQLEAPSEELELGILAGENEPHGNEPENQNALYWDVVNQEHGDEEPENHPSWCIC